MKMEDLRELFVHGLQDVYDAEKRILEALEKMQEKATNEELVAAFETHASETVRQIEILEKVFESVGEKAKAHPCEAIKGILEEGDSIMKDAQEGAVRDAGMIMAAQKVEHYEIATYGTLCTYAEQLGETEAHKWLGEILSQEEGTDKKLSRLAISTINEDAREAA